MPALRTTELQAPDLQTIISRHDWPEEALLMAFAEKDFWFESYTGQLDFLPQTDQGRIFSAQGELSWRRLGSRFRAVYLGHEPLDSDILENADHELADLSPFTRSLFLWGVRTDNEQEWIEQQVPHRFDYPLKKQSICRGRVQLLLEEWRNEQGLTKFCRYHSLKETEKGAKYATGE